jgi:hypothetical protein
MQFWRSCEQNDKIHTNTVEPLSVDTWNEVHSSWTVVISVTTDVGHAIS